MNEYNYKSPIEIISNEVEMYIEDEIAKAVQKVGIVVDKYELYKALTYDREQYKKGYYDAESKIIKCGECKYRDPEDHKCDNGMLERAGCIFPVADDYYCKYGERRADE
jgi:hypothetical protein